MEPRQRPRLHARDHMPGGADPIDFSGIQIGSTLPGLASVLYDLGADNLWKFDEASGTTAHDLLGGLDLTVGGSVTWGGPESPPGTASVASGGQRWTNASFPALSDNFSAGVWIRTSIISSYQSIMGQGAPIRAGGGSDQGWTIATDISSNKPGMYLSTGASQPSFHADNALVADTWTLLGFTAESNVWTLYVDGEAQADTETLAVSTYIGAGLWFGHDGGTNIENYDGYLSWGFVFQDETLSADDWAAIYAGAFPFSSDGNVLTADGAGGTKWRAAAGTGGIEVSFTDDELVIDGSAVTGSGALEVYVDGS